MPTTKTILTQPLANGFVYFDSASGERLCLQDLACSVGP